MGGASSEKKQLKLTKVSNPLVNDKNKVANTNCLLFGWSSMLYDNNQNTLYVCGYNEKGELGLGEYYEKKIKKFTLCPNKWFL